MSLSLLPFPLPLPLEQALRAAYAVPPRAYHDFAHVEEVLGHFASAAGRWHDPVSAALALLLHDAVYQPGRSDNEAQSAELAAALLPAHLAPRSIDLPRVQELILLTARHGKLAVDDVDADAALFLDCDMAVLGAPWARFAQYERAIAIEYGALPPEVFQAGRARFLQGLLGRDVIYLSEFFRERFERPARDNLERSLRQLPAARH